LDNLVVVGLVVLIFVLSVFFGYQFFTFRKSTLKSIEDRVIDKLNSRAHYIAIEFLKVYEMKNDMNKVIELERCNKMLSDYGYSFRQEVAELLSKEAGENKNKVVSIQRTTN
jgi:hypothetical protein